MAYEYLENLRLSDEDKMKLKVLGARTPAALLSRLQYSPEARQKIVDYLGSEATVSEIESALKSLTNGVREPLPPFKPNLGALDTPATPDLQSSQSERDALVRQIQDLRASGEEAEAEKRANELRQLLKQS